MNLVIIKGSVVTDPSQKGENSPCEFRVKTVERLRDVPDDKKKYDRQIHNVAVWGKKGSFCQQNLKKGMSILIKGVIKYTTKEVVVTDKNGKPVIVDGKKLKITKYFTEIKAVEIDFAF